MNKVKILLLISVFIVLGLTLVNSVSCADYIILQESNPYVANFTASGTGTLADYTGVNSYGGSGRSIRITTSSAMFDRYLLYTPFSTDFIATNSVYVSFWYNFLTTGLTATKSVYIYYNGVQVASASISSNTVWSGTVGAWITPIPNAQIQIRLKVTNGASWTVHADEIVMSFSDTPYTTDTYLQLYDEATQTDLASFGGITLTPIEEVSGDNLSCTIGTDYFKIYTFGTGIDKIKCVYGNINLFTRYLYCEDSVINNLTVSLSPTEYLVSVIDTTDTFGVGTHFKVIKEWDGVNYTIDEQTLSWSKICYSPLIENDYYVLMLINPEGENIVYGNVSVYDNPIYIVLDIASDGEGSINVSVANITQVQTVDFDISSNWTIPDLSSTFVATITNINSYDFGHILLTTVPFFVLTVGFKKRMFLYSAVAIAISFVFNLALGSEVYSQSVLGIALALNVFMIYSEGEAKD